MGRGGVVAICRAIKNESAIRTRDRVRIVALFCPILAHGCTHVTFLFRYTYRRKSTRSLGRFRDGKRGAHIKIYLFPPAAAAAAEVIDIPREGTCPLFSATGAPIVRFVNSPFAVLATTR